MRKRKGIAIKLTGDSILIDKLWQIMLKYYNSKELEGIEIIDNTDIIYMIALKDIKSRQNNEQSIKEFTVENTADILKEIKEAIDSKAEYRICLLPTKGWEQHTYSLNKRTEKKEKGIPDKQDIQDKHDIQDTQELISKGIRYKIEHRNKNSITYWYNKQYNKW